MDVTTTAPLSSTMPSPDASVISVEVSDETGVAAQIICRTAGDPDAGLHLLAIHGLFDDAGTWSYLLPHLRRDDLYVVIVDLLGAGSSSKPGLNHLPSHQRYSLDLHVDCLQQVITTLKLRDVVLLGSSLGGGIALRLAIRTRQNQPPIRGLILEDAAGYATELPVLMQQFINWPGRLLRQAPARWLLQSTGLARWLVTRSIHRAFHDRARIPTDLLNRHLQVSKSAADLHAARETVRNMVPSDMDAMIESYGHIRIPALVLWGRQDRILSPLYAQRLADDLPLARLHIIEGCGHAPHLECPEEMARIVHEWLDEMNRTP